jgi:dGTPase
MINRQITDLLEASRDRIAGAAPADIESVRTQSSPLIGFGAEMREQGLELKRFLRENLYRHYRVIRMTAKAGRILRALFEAFMEEPGLLPPEPANRLKTAVAPGVLPPATLVRPCTADQNLGMTGRARIITDYIAGMTDRYAITEYDRVFNPSYLS